MQFINEELRGNVIHIYITYIYIYIYIQGEFYFVCQSLYRAGDYRLHNKLIGT